jgi:hypothetical protein
MVIIGTRSFRSMVRLYDDMTVPLCINCIPTDHTHTGLLPVIHRYGSPS